MLSEERIIKFQALYKKNFGQELTREEAYEKGAKMLRIVQLTYKPITEKEYRDWQTRRNKKLTNNIKNMEEEKVKKLLKKDFFAEGMAIEDGAILETAITESEIQEWAESNFDRKLTDIEVNRITECWFECEKAMELRYEFLNAIVEDALNNENNVWEETDKDFLARSNTATK